MGVGKPRRFWKRLLDFLSPIFVVFYFYLLIAASHNSQRGLVLDPHDWRTKFLLYTVVFVGLAIVWTYSIFVRKRGEGR